MKPSCDGEEFVDMVLSLLCDAVANILSILSKLDKFGIFLSHSELNMAKRVNLCYQDKQV